MDACRDRRCSPWQCRLLDFLKLIGRHFLLQVRSYSAIQPVTKECKERNATRTYGTSVSSGCCAGGGLFREMRGVLCVEELLEARGAGGTGTRRVTTIGRVLPLWSSGNQPWLCWHVFALSHSITKLTSLPIMSKPITTYMRKKNQTLRQLGDYQATSVSCDSRTLHNKRSRAQSIAHKSSLSTKKLRISDDESQIQTPYPTALTESLIFKLPASNVLPLSPDHQFSPVPLAPKNKNVSSSSAASNRRAYTRSSNKFLKENAIGRSSALVASYSSSRSHFQPKIIPQRPDMPDSVHQMTLATRISGINLAGASIDGALDELASPFSSRPSSPFDSPGKINDIDPALQAVHATLRKANDSSGLHSSCTFNASEPLFSRSVRTQAQSTTTSPVKSPHLSTLNIEPLSSASIRRPSAPTASRPRLDSWARFLPQVSDPLSHQDGREPLEMAEGMCTGPQKLAAEQPRLEPRPVALQKHEKWIWTDAAVDFNRPPSQLSFNSDFFNDAQGASTPLRRAKSNHETYLVTEDLGNERETGSHSPSPSPFGRSALSDAMGSWITDSLISPPSEYRRRKGPNSLDGSGNLENADNEEDDDNDYFSGCLREGAATGSSYTVQAQTCEDINLAIRTENLSVRDGTLLGSIHC